jgi:hypothetical protein
MNPIAQPEHVPVELVVSDISAIKLYGQFGVYLHKFPE